MKIKYFEWTDFYDFYENIKDPKVKKLLQKIMATLCRVDGKTIRNWLSKKSIPFYQSNRVTEAVRLIAVHLNMEPHHITEKMLFPHYALEIEAYANNY